VTEAGNYTIHTLVYPSDLDLSIVELGVTTGFDVNSLLIQGGGDLCASLDVAGAPIHVGEEPCTADAGTLHATADSVNLLNGSATLTATPGGELVQPAGFAVLYVLTSGDDLVIEQVGGSPEFTVTEAGNYTIHTLVYPSDLDLSIVELGVTTGFDVNSLLIQGGGDLCGSLDVAGAPIHVGEEPCTADAGTLTAVDSNVELLNGEAQLSATPNGDINIPAGFSNIFVLTSGDDLVIEQVNSTPNFTVTEAGDYTIHTLVFPSDLDLSIVELGVTTGFDVNSLLIQGGGDLCASLDVAGAPIHVNAAEDTCTANAGTLYSYHPIQCLDYGVATIYADEVEAPVIPEGYNQLFVLTNAFNLTILDVSTTAEFTVNHAGFYRIHSLVYDPATLDLSIVQFGYTTAFDVVHLLQQGGGDICASLDVRGALNLVLPSWFCNLYGSYAEAGRNPQGDLVNDWLNQYDDYQNFEDAMLAEFTETSVYPNPVKTTLNINTLLLQDEIVNYTILDMQGRLLKRGVINTISSDRHQIEMSNISSGTYIVQLSSEFRNFTTKIQVN
uniref:T9SS type A sorting domain-containing protein n=1 Tax=uncultured Winogradskyella sp. TaxID=395353 RepID=UPI00260F4201